MTIIKLKLNKELLPILLGVVSALALISCINLYTPSFNTLSIQSEEALRIVSKTPVYHVWEQPSLSFMVIQLVASLAVAVAAYITLSYFVFKE